MTERMILFAAHYVALKFNATAAAKKAGYSKKTAYCQGQRLTKNVEVKKLIEKHINKALSQTDKMTLAWLQDVEKLQNSNIKNIMTWTKDGSVIIKNSVDIPDDIAYAISEISQTKDGIKIKLESKTKAMELKGKYLAILNDSPPADETKTEKKEKVNTKERIAFLTAKREKNASK